MTDYKTEQEIQTVVRGFEECTTAKDDFNHVSHLTVAVYYLNNFGMEEAVAKMRDGLFCFIDHHGINRAKYNEELTRNWFQLVRNAMEQAAADDSLVTITNAVIDQLRDSQKIKRSTPSAEALI